MDGCVFLGEYLEIKAFGTHDTFSLINRIEKKEESEVHDFQTKHTSYHTYIP